jgi:hypothetical protein
MRAWIDRVAESQAMWRYRMRAVFWGPLIVGATVGFLFATIPQSREVYLGLIEDRQVFKGFLGVVFVVLLCALLNFWQHMLGTAAIDRMYLEHADIHIDQHLIAFRNRLCQLSVALPLLGLSVGLIKLGYDVFNAHSSFEAALQHFGSGKFPQYYETLDQLQRLPWEIGVTGAIGAVLLFTCVYARPRANTRAAESLKKIEILIGVAVTLAALFVPLLLGDRIINIARFIGPLASSAIVVIALVCVLIGLSYLSSRLRLPIVGTIVFTLLGFVCFETYATLIPKTSAVGRQSNTPMTTPGTETVGAVFDEWFNDRRKTTGSDRYPIFIVSAQGGGIYAASATSAFLATMQDRCPGFADHIFAISGVSGGAVGATLFDAALAEANGGSDRSSTVSGCLKKPNGDLAGKLRSVVQQDHLSPTLALIWSDIVRTFDPNPGFDRSSVLEESFLCAFDNAFGRSVQGGGCRSDSQTAGGLLELPFEEHWHASGSVPALLLNTTWVETGFRATFAPFPLYAIGDGTLYSFVEDFQKKGADIQPSRSLLQAAFVSARFPGIVPAWPLDARLRSDFNGGSSRRWSFVDGGYVDDSGSSTALELYRRLDEHIKEAIDAGNDIYKRIDLYLIMLTDANTDLALSDIEPNFNDAAAPLTALLRVRDQLAGRAVTRAVDELAPGANADDLSGHGNKPSRVLKVNLTQKTFELPLGWKISRTTDDIVQLMLGSPDLCGEANRSRALEDDAKHVADAIRVIDNNSCVKERIITLLGSE